jgi:hypothetical protein
MQDPVKKLTPKRTLEVADSLMKESYAKKGLGNMNKKIAEAFIKKGKGNEALFGSREFSGRGAITANERLQKSKKDLEESAMDSSNAARYRKLALKAMTKNK